MQTLVSLAKGIYLQLLIALSNLICKQLVTANLNQYPYLSVSTLVTDFGISDIHVLGVP